MPIYEYECKNCHHHFDLMQKISDLPVKQCPQCFENSVVRLVSAAGFQLKGTGWYVTDFKNKEKNKKEEKVQTKEPPVSEKKATESPTVKTEKKGDKE